MTEKMSDKSPGKTSSPDLDERGEGVVPRNGRALAIAQADAAQREASDPMASVFVSASAGSGKTKLLIDRLLRLMLPVAREDERGERVLVPGSDPGRILCLTYTKAAAAEMATRLQDKLGHWVTLPEEALGVELEKLAVPDTPETRALARGLFLRVLDLPGGLRIETIHAFCQSLLRRFPIEAAIDPHFALMEDTDSAQALRQALEEVLGADPKQVEQLAGLVSLDDLMKRVTGLNEKSGRLQPLLDRFEIHPARVRQEYARLLGIAPAENEAAVLAPVTPETLRRAAQRPAEEEALREDLRAALPKTTASAREKYAQPLLDWLALPPEERVPENLHAVLFTQSGLRKMNAIAGKEAQKRAPLLIERLEREAERQKALQESARALTLLEINQDFLAVAAPVLARFQREKTMRGLVDYNDLIARTRLLLKDPGAAWVLYKLDGGIDHLLLDEVQDTSGLQWQIAGALTEEFFNGEGARDLPRPRTIFAVGDFKQSIYSFQGAEPEQFHHWRRVFADRVRNAGLTWREPDLNVSFRSVTPVLELVDSVFSDDEAADGLREAGSEKLLPHVSARPGQGGRVELWPLVPAKETEDDGEAGSEETDAEVGAGLAIGDAPLQASLHQHPQEQKQEQERPVSWRAPERNASQRSAPQRLADDLADWLKENLGKSPQPGAPPLRPEDVLILVPRRSAFLRYLIRALKSRHVPVASFLRAGLTEQAAVQDLMTLCATLLLPQDDLSLACVLTSPFGGLTDESLMALCLASDGPLLGKGGQPLWSVLRDRHAERPEWRSAWERLSALYRRVDYATPYGLLVQALGEQGGRARLLARLGPEAAEPLDELLNAALAYEERHTPSLQGFLHWLRASDITTKREAESALDAVRLMTVHGAKGLQARLVVLPDTTSERLDDRDVLWTETEEGVEAPVWVPRKDMGVAATTHLAERARQRRLQESNRLLYVALTRASDMLVICGWEPGRGKKDEDGARTPGERSWYQLCAQGFDALPNVRTVPLGGGREGEKRVLEEVRRETTASPIGKSPDEPAPAQGLSALPAWLGRAPEWKAAQAPLEAALARPLTPSRPEGAEFGPQPAARSPLERLALQTTSAQRNPSPLKISPLKTGASQSGSSQEGQEGFPLTQENNRLHALRRGTLAHRLLQLLPDVPPAQRAERALSFLMRPGWDLAPEEAQTLAEQIMAVLESPVLAPLFGPGSRAEQTISGTLADTFSDMNSGTISGAFSGKSSALENSAGKPAEKRHENEGRVVLGQVDRFCLHDGAVWLCDYKTGRRPPATLAQTPKAYVRQMASYRAVMQQLYPDYPVRCFLVWTEGAQYDGPLVTELPPRMLDAALLSP